MSEMFVLSLRNRIRAMNTLWQRAVADMTLDHVNHQEREAVLPIAFSLSHFMRAQDQAVSGPFVRGQTLWDAGGWASPRHVRLPLEPPAALARLRPGASTDRSAGREGRGPGRTGAAASRPGPHHDRADAAPRATPVTEPVRC